ncbi:MAG TPA: hypothetical protein VFT22_42920 [Kofleriaceae bacterium]|nr:hypothetical protein [Kofleriaceae bacterium]
MSPAILIYDDDPDTHGARNRTLRGFAVRGTGWPFEAPGPLTSRGFDAARPAAITSPPDEPGGTGGE